MKNIDKSTPSPSTEGLVAFLSSPYIKGIGKVYAKKIVEQLGINAIEKILENPSVLDYIPGLGLAKREDVLNSLSKISHPVDLLLTLYSSGLSDTDVEKIISHYKKLANDVVFYDPYEMVEDVWRFSFFSADKIGNYLKIAKNDPRRLRGAVLAALRIYAENGHIYATDEEVKKTASRITGVEQELFEPEIKNLVEDGRIIQSHNSLYLPVYYKAEKEGAQKIASLIQNYVQTTPADDIPTLDIFGHELSSAQRAAIATVIDNPFTVITGGPGTGKTTAVRGLIELLEKQNKKIVLVAPTGRAAKRLADLTGHEALTIHRLLGYRPGEGYHNKKLDADVLIIDEASMLEQVLFNHLLQALKPGTRIILVGDVNQLPPIGAGDVLKDLIASGIVPVITLDYNFRQQGGSLIALNAKAINDGQLPRGDAGKDFLVIIENSARKIHARILDLVSRELPERFDLDPKDIQVVSPQQDGILGTRQLNIDIQEKVNPSGPSITKGSKTFRVGDRVMQTSNSSIRKTYNGETGWVSEVNEEEESIEVTFRDGKVSVYNRSELGELSLAYATTVHKLQGSETDYMVMVLSLGHHRLLYRNLLYTAVSRAKHLCVIIGEEKAIKMAVENNHVTKRNSNFRWRLRKYIYGSDK